MTDHNPLPEIPKIKDKLELATKNFNPSSPATPEEFTNALEDLVSFLLFDIQVWQDYIVSSRKVLRKFPLLKDLPMVCKGVNCPYAEKCDILRGAKENNTEDSLIGTDCRNEQLYAVQLFTDLVTELNIKPDQSTDILIVTNLIRLMILKRRIDWDISTRGMIIQEPVAVTITKEALFKKASHPLLKESEKIDRQINILFSQLVASRKDKIAVAAQLGRSRDVIADLFAGNFGEDEDRNILEADFRESSDEE